MSPYEREVVKRIYPLACNGDPQSIKILANLTTKHNKGFKCIICGTRFRGRKKPQSTNQFCSMKCLQVSMSRKKIPLTK